MVVYFVASAFVISRIAAFLTKDHFLQLALCVVVAFLNGFLTAQAGLSIFREDEE
jgi:hypothetical protein